MPLNQRNKKKQQPSSPSLSILLFQHFHRRQRNFISITGGITFVLLMLHYISLEHSQQTTYNAVEEKQSTLSSLRGMETEELLYEDALLKQKKEEDGGSVVYNGYTLDTLSHILMDKPADEKVVEDESPSSLADGIHVKQDEELHDDMTLLPAAAETDTMQLLNTAEAEGNDKNNNYIRKEEIDAAAQESSLNNNNNSNSNNKEVQIMEGTVPMKYFLNTNHPNTNDNEQFTVVDLPYIHCSTTPPPSPSTQQPPNVAQMILLKGSNDYTASSTWHNSGVLSKLCLEETRRNAQMKVTAIDLNVQVDGKQLYNAYEALVHGKVINQESGVIWITPLHSGNALLDLVEEFSSSPSSNENLSNLVKAWITIGTNAPSKILQMDTTTLTNAFLKQSIPILSIVNSKEEQKINLGIQDRLVQYAGGQVVEMTTGLGGKDNGDDGAFYVENSNEFVHIVLDFLD